MSEEPKQEKQNCNGTELAERPTQGKMPTIAMGNRGMQLASLEDAWRFASYLSRSGLAPKGLEKPEAILIAIQMGAEIGLPPMAALQNIAVINGRPAVWGDAMLAVCRSSGVFDEAAFEETISPDGKTASCTVRRYPHGNPVTRTFSMDDAKAASLAGKSGPWSQYPTRMLQMRARSWALRDAFSDVLRGLLAVEEARDVIDVQAVEAPTSLEQLTQRLEAKQPEVKPEEAEGKPESVQEPTKPRRQKSLIDTQASATEAGS